MIWKWINWGHVALLDKKILHSFYDFVFAEVNVTQPNEIYEIHVVSQLFLCTMYCLIFLGQVGALSWELK